jgi:hypothetical protein
LGGADLGGADLGGPGDAGRAGAKPALGAGIVSTAWHCGHFIFLPPKSSGACSFLPQAHANRIAMVEPSGSFD